jgi:dienelactone hydrolase
MLMAALGSSCAGSQPPAPAAPAPPRNADHVSLEVFRLLRADDVGAVVELFSMRLSSALTSNDLREVWRAVIDELGPLRSYTIVERGREGALDTRSVALVFERGRARGMVAIDSTTGEVGGLWVVPDEGKGPAEAPSGERPLPPGVVARSLVVGSAPIKLEGILTTPAGPGPFPAVLLVHGSGPQDRDETIGPNKPFKDIAESLAQKGVACLRYDKRTRAYPKLPDADKITVEDEVIEDALAALQILAAQPEVRRDGIFVVGHSLGAQLAPEIGARSRAVAGLVLLAPPGRKLTDMVIEQLQTLKSVPAEEIAKLKVQAARIAAGEADPRERFMGVPAAYFTDLLRRDPFAQARALGLPILALRGDRDYQVTAEDQGRWKAALGGQAGFEAHTLPRLNHLFIEGTGTPGPAEYARPGRVHPIVSVRIAAFVKRWLPPR